MHLPSKLLNSWFNSNKKLNSNQSSYLLKLYFGFQSTDIFVVKLLNVFASNIVNTNFSDLSQCFIKVNNRVSMLDLLLLKLLQTSRWDISSQPTKLSFCKLLNISDAAFKILNFLLWKLNTFGLIHLCLLTVERLIEVRTI